MARPAAAALGLLALLLAAAAPAPAAAGCRRRVRSEPLPREEMFFNHQPAPQLSLEELPKSFDWNSVDGRSMLVGAGGGWRLVGVGGCYLCSTSAGWFCRVL